MGMSSRRPNLHRRLPRSPGVSPGVVAGASSPSRDSSLDVDAPSCYSMNPERYGFYRVHESPTLSLHHRRVFSDYLRPLYDTATPEAPGRDRRATGSARSRTRRLPVGATLPSAHGRPAAPARAHAAHARPAAAQALTAHILPVARCHLDFIHRPSRTQWICIASFVPA